MSVISEEKDDKLILEIDNGDLTKFKQALDLWNLKDAQSFWRFTVSILIEAQDQNMWIKSEGEAIQVVPADHSLRK